MTSCDVDFMRPELYRGELLDDFLAVYSRRPLRTNPGGMGINHSYALFFALRQLKPSFVIESGVFRGQSTWLIEQAVPEAKIYSLDPCPEMREYTSGRAEYLIDDFSGIDWSCLDAENTLCFFDDHQSALSRLKDMKWWGFRRAIFEDNYPLGQGDCYSLRQVFGCVGHPLPNLTQGAGSSGLRAVLGRKLGMRGGGINSVADLRKLQAIYWRQEIIRRPNNIDKISVERNLLLYHEFQPLLINPTQRWGAQPWEEEYSLSSQPVFSSLSDCDALAYCLADMSANELKAELSYTYISYVELSPN